MQSSEENDAYHREHLYTLPVEGSIITSPVTGITYVIGESLSEGGFSHVFACYDDWGHSLVAKVLKPVGDWQKTQERAISEVLTQSIGRSPHIVHVCDTLVYRGAYYIFTERCAFTLREMIADGAVHPPTWFPALSKAVLHALHFMHTQQLIHCDVHPGNIFLQCVLDTIDPDEQSALLFKVGDFGLTRPIGEIHPKGTFHKDLIPPEAIDPDAFGPLDHRADLYQAGRLFLDFLSGKELRFSTEEILSGRPRDMAESLPHPAGPVIAKLLRRHSSSRFATALEAWLDLKECLFVQ